MMSPTMMGEEWPEGIAVFQATFLLGPNSFGICEFSEMPVPLGPRNCVQSAAGRVKTRVHRRRRIGDPSILLRNELLGAPVEDFRSVDGSVGSDSELMAVVELAGELAVGTECSHDFAIE